MSAFPSQHGQRRAAGLGPTTVNFPSPQLNSLVDSTDILSSPTDLKSRMKQDGYLYIRNLLPRVKVMGARRAVLQHMKQSGVLDTSCGQCSVHPNSNSKSKSGNEENEAKMASDAPPLFKMEGFGDIATHPAVKSLLECSELHTFFRRYFDTDNVKTFDYKWLRAVGHDQYTGVHCDSVYMNRGSTNLHTVWIPLGDVNIEQGSLAICSGSNSLSSYDKVRNTYGRLDVDRDKTEGWLSKDPLEISNKYGGQWLSSDFRAGDVLIFGMHTLHASTTNLTACYRLSCDVRFQPSKDAVDERWVLDHEEEKEGGEGRGTGHTSHRKEALRSMDDARKEWGI